MTSVRQDLARGGALSFVGSATSAVMGLVLIIVLGRELGDAGSGVVLQTIAILTIALSVSRLGMDSAAIWILPRILDDEPEQVRPAVIFLLTIAASMGAMCAVILWVGTLSLEAHRPGDPLAESLQAVLWFVPVGSAMQTALAATRGLGKVTAYTFIGNVMLPTMRPISVVGAVAVGAGIVGASVAWALPVVPALLAAAAVLLVQTRGLAPAPTPRYVRSGLAKQASRYAFPRVLSSSLEQLLAWLAVILVGLLAGPAAAGVYGVASRLVAAGMIVDSALRVVVSPMFSKLHHRNDRRNLEELYRIATTWLVLFSTPVYLLLASYAPIVLAMIGEPFADGEPLVMIMCSGAILTFMAGNIHSVLLMSGRSGLAAANKAVAVAVNIALLYLLVPLWGLPGAALAWVVATGSDAFMALIEVRLVLRLRVSLLPGLYPLLVGFATVGSSAIACRWLFGTTWTGLAVASAIGGGLFLLWCRGDSGRLHLRQLAVRAHGRE